MPPQADDPPPWTSSEAFHGERAGLGRVDEAHTISTRTQETEVERSTKEGSGGTNEGKVGGTEERGKGKVTGRLRGVPTSGHKIAKNKRGIPATPRHN